MRPGVIGVTEGVAHFVRATHLESLPPNVVQGAKLSILDTLGVMLAAARQPIGRIITEHVRDEGGPSIAHVVGATCATSAPLAALANGTLANGLDFDGLWHVPTHTLPAALAVGEMLGASGAHVLEAYVAAHEVATRIKDTIEPRRAEAEGLTFRGWYHVSLYGAIAASLAAARLLDLNTATMQSAMGIAAASAGGVRRTFGTMAKALGSGNAARDGVNAALLARRGFTGDQAILEAPLGLVQTVCLPGEEDWEPLLNGLGQPFALGEPLGFKRYAAVGPAQRIVEAVLTIRRDHAPRMEDVVSIETNADRFALPRDHPHDGLAGVFSLPYLVAIALLEGEVGVDQVSDARVNDPHVRALMARVSPIRMPLPPDEAARVVIRLRDGRELSADVQAVPRVTGPAAVEAKFRACARHTLAPAAIDHLHQQVMDLEHLPAITARLDTATTLSPG
jgi:2-methylcitrate dehydratase PrpD